MATALAPVCEREVVRCDRCRLVQFPTISNLCRKCHIDLDYVESAAAPLVNDGNGDGNGNGNGHHRLNLSGSIRSLRLRCGLSQRQLAERMKVPRTWVSKLETKSLLPTLSSLERLATALEVGVRELLTAEEDHHLEEVRDLMQDKFVAEITPFAIGLGVDQRRTVLVRVRELMEERRRMRSVRVT